MKIKFKKLNPLALEPKQSTDGAAAYDLYTIDEGMIRTKGVTSFDTGIAIEIPSNYVGLVFGRSGFAFKDAIQLCNCVGIIDSDYRNSIKVGFVKHDDQAFFHIKKGDRIAQIMFVKLPKITFEEVKELSDTKRGAGGLGSTGQAMTVQEAIEKL